MPLLALSHGEVSRPMARAEKTNWTEPDSNPLAGRALPRRRTLRQESGAEAWPGRSLALESCGRLTQRRRGSRAGLKGATSRFSGTAAVRARCNIRRVSQPFAAVQRVTNRTGETDRDYR